MEKKNEEFEKTLQSFSSDIQNIAKQTRQLIYDTLSGVVEVVWVKQKNYRVWNRHKKEVRTFLLGNAFR